MATTELLAKLLPKGEILTDTDIQSLLEEGPTGDPYFEDLPDMDDLALMGVLPEEEDDIGDDLLKLVAQSEGTIPPAEIEKIDRAPVERPARPTLPDDTDATFILSLLSEQDPEQLAVELADLGVEQLMKVASSVNKAVKKTIMRHQVKGTGSTVPRGLLKWVGKQAQLRSTLLDIARTGKVSKGAIAAELNYTGKDKFAYEMIHLRLLAEAFGREGNAKLAASIRQAVRSSYPKIDVDTCTVFDATIATTVYASSLGRQFNSKGAARYSQARDTAEQLCGKYFMMKQQLPFIHAMRSENKGDETIVGTNTDHAPNITPHYTQAVYIEPVDKAMLGVLKSVKPTVGSVASYVALTKTLLDTARENFFGPADPVAQMIRQASVFEVYEWSISKQRKNHRSRWPITRTNEDVIDYFTHMGLLAGPYPAFTTLYEPDEFTGFNKLSYPSTWISKWTKQEETVVTDEHGDLVTDTITVKLFDFNLPNLKSQAGFPYGNHLKLECISDALAIADTLWSKVKMYDRERLVEQHPELLYSVMKMKGEVYPYLTPIPLSTRDPDVLVSVNELEIQEWLDLNKTAAKIRTIFIPNMAATLPINLIHSQIWKGSPSVTEDTKDLERSGELFERLAGTLIPLKGVPLTGGAFDILMRRITCEAPFNTRALMETSGRATFHYSDNNYLLGRLALDLNIDTKEVRVVVAPTIDNPVTAWDGGLSTIPKGTRVLISLDESRAESCTHFGHVKQYTSMLCRFFEFPEDLERFYQKIYNFAIVSNIGIAGNAALKIPYMNTGHPDTFTLNDLGQFVQCRYYERAAYEGVEGQKPLLAPDRVDPLLFIAIAEKLGTKVKIERITILPDPGTPLTEMTDNPVEIDWLGYGVTAIDIPPPFSLTARLYVPVLERDRMAKSILFMKTGKRYASVEDPILKMNEIRAVKAISLLFNGGVWDPVLRELLCTIVAQEPSIFKSFASAEESANIDDELGDMADFIKEMTSPDRPEDDLGIVEMAKDAVEQEKAQTLGNVAQQGVLPLMEYMLTHIATKFAYPYTMSENANIIIGTGGKTAHLSWSDVAVDIDLTKDLAKGLDWNRPTDVEQLKKGLIGAMINLGEKYPWPVTSEVRLGRVVSHKFPDNPGMRKCRNAFMKLFSMPRSKVSLFNSLLSRALLLRPDLAQDYSEVATKVATEQEEREIREAERRKRVLQDRENRAEAKRARKKQFLEPVEESPVAHGGVSTEPLPKNLRLTANSKMQLTYTEMEVDSTEFIHLVNSRISTQKYYGLLAPKIVIGELTEDFVKKFQFDKVMTGYTVYGLWPTYITALRRVEQLMAPLFKDSFKTVVKEAITAVLPGPSPNCVLLPNIWKGTREEFLSKLYQYFTQGKQMDTSYLLGLTPVRTLIRGNRQRPFALIESITVLDAAKLIVLSKKIPDRSLLIRLVLTGVLIDLLAMKAEIGLVAVSDELLGAYVSSVRAIEPVVFVLHLFAEALLAKPFRMR